VKLWGGRFQSDLTEETEAFTESTEIDKRMILHDIWGSQAHAIMLTKQDIISEDVLFEILKWLEKAHNDFIEGKFELKPELEDVHMNVESYLIEGAGKEYGGKLHTARSRNDQVITDARLYIREQILDTQALLCNLCRCFLQIADDHSDTVMPGYTHTQHAQPITLGFWATAYVSMFLRDLRRLSSAYSCVNTNPLGSCALAGTSFETNRELTTKLLGFDEIHQHSLDAISSRDFITETVSALAILMSNLSKLAEEMVYWSTYEFRMVVIHDSYAFGSSIMPQKKNPGIAELTRARTGKVYGALFELLTNLKGLPMGYNRDLQEDKPPVWKALDITQSCLSVLSGMISTAKFQTDRMAELAGANFSTATELANFLVTQYGIPFRKCHEIVGGLVGDLVEKGLTFNQLDEIQKLLSERDVQINIQTLKEMLDAKSAVTRNKSLGGTSPSEVKRMSGEFLSKLELIENELESKYKKIEDAKRLTESIVKKVLSEQND